MEDKLNESELITHSDGSVYHLRLIPGEIAPMVITVGDPERVNLVSQCFDHVELRKHNREFCTHTGTLGKHRLSVISTGIGLGGVEIVMHEIDQLFNVDLKARVFKEIFSPLKFIRLGTSGTIHPELPLGSIALTKNSFGISNFHRIYAEQSFASDDVHLFECDGSLFDLLSNKQTISTNTLTLPGFYLPQGRPVRNMSHQEIASSLSALVFNGHQIHHLEMETAGLFQMAKIMGHQAASMSAILADRIAHKFAANPEKLVKRMIESCLESICHETI